VEGEEEEEEEDVVDVVDVIGKRRERVDPPLGEVVFFSSEICSIKNFGADFKESTLILADYFC